MTCIQSHTCTCVWEEICHTEFAAPFIKVAVTNVWPFIQNRSNSGVVALSQSRNSDRFWPELVRFTSTVSQSITCDTKHYNQLSLDTLIMMNYEMFLLCEGTLAFCSIPASFSHYAYYFHDHVSLFSHQIWSSFRITEATVHPKTTLVFLQITRQFLCWQRVHSQKQSSKSHQTPLETVIGLIIVILLKVP